MRGMDGGQGLSRRVWQTGLLFVAFVLSFALYVYGEKQIDRANERRQLSFHLADQLRQSSDDLTRMVRSYVATGDAEFKRSYHDILDIREGAKPRPDNFDNFYWYLTPASPGFARPEAGPGLSLMEMMRQAGFSNEEFQRLSEAKARSDELTLRELEAMRLAEVAGPADPDARLRAVRMVHDEEYHRGKAAIMTPIREFNDLVEQRTLAAVRRAETVAFALRLVFMAFAIAVGTLLWLTYAEARAILGGSVPEVHERITRIGQGDFTMPENRRPRDGGSVLAGLDRMAEKLGAMEAERARTTAELEDKNKALERSNADLEQFAYVASHDLQTPLRNIVSYTQLMERRYKGRLDADADEFIAFIVANTKQMNQLILDLLEYSRASRQTVVLEACSAGEAMVQARDNLRQDMDMADVEVRVGPLPEVITLQSHLVSLFQNLLGNSIKYRSADRPALISVTAEPAADGFWHFAVADNGIGIDPQYHDKVFELFQRLSPTAQAEGTGIGLTLCRRIVERSGGKIWLESEPGRGATVHFTLRGA
ncbi:Putative Signal transduction histidine kinase(Signal transduction histidine kinase, homodimeric,299-387;ATPase-like, ATP-binding domain,383-535) [Magnetospirillum sp. XM-1]|uniref:sensor histidine kinase n=1 Tax=Magnetospirillum sp. XM-1 TaxID=1663591 RepID=UPI00073DD31F|nr:ATP-binding protein [Magnetospirillum sp. XM-1]CUW38929.1 Putative Signal transduction histidine kinase(Signal transduction histidine kinase, homodimeric,299-387;ATPase-like, ATP-binding domain,383-535) [Magnetospirillum sp. XM-1]